MGNAIWLFRALPDWFFSSILSPFQAGMLTSIPSAGTVCLAIGLALAIFGRRQPRLFAFVVPVLATQAFVAIAGFMRGQLTTDSATAVIYAFFAVQIVLAGILIYCATSARIAAAFLAIFSLSYAWFAGFVAGMAFTNQWL
jgi:hypothetical protein